ncbi:elongation factor P hydroxylase [Bacterioplanes sanyensis]|uniref:elongation factor P hydroxylase n=1 Tax=Bacterioplanes sanyensis TaxID=1249553 RepID=UPI0018EEA6CC|nr:elongation factor P hydroxylase [Bacterioplanes sanyensis]
MKPELNVEDLIQLFNTLFVEGENTRLVAGDDEPIYLPADEHTPHHRLIFAHGFYESALHEISHWCIAGSERRQLVDFGYWYEPDGRSAAQQRAFEQVEVKPQALEWILSVACGRRFRVSTDNLNGEADAVEHGLAQFRLAVGEQAQRYLQQGLPARAERLRQALLTFYQRHDDFVAYRFDASQI